MPTSIRRADLVPAAIVVAILLGWAPAGLAGGKAPKGKPPRAAPDRPAETLPQGCARLADGYGGVASPDGKAIAFLHGRSLISLYWSSVRGAETAELRVRDVKSDETWPLPPAARPVGWVGGTLLLDTGVGVDPRTGVRSTRVASVPWGTDVAVVAWTSDGKRLAWVPRTTGRTTTAVHVLGSDGKERVLEGTAGLRTDQAVLLAWSPDGTRIYLNGLFQAGEGQVPTRRVGLGDATTGAMTALATMPDWVGIPGLNARFPFYRDPRIEDPKLIEIPWETPAEPRYGPQAFSGDGRLVAWLAGTGWIEADAFVAEVATGEVRRLTNDGEAKWSPALDPTARRLAFFTADGMAGGGIDDTYQHARIRVLDLVTGEPADVELAVADGVPGRLTWSADGKSLVYDVRPFFHVRGATGGPGREGTFSQAVPPPKAAPAGAKPFSAEYSPRNRIVAWLGSYDADHVHTAVHRAEDGWDPYYLPALREALQKWLNAPGVLPCLVHLLDRRQVKEAVPDLRAALATTVEAHRISLLVALLHLGERDAIEGLAGMLASTKDEDLRLEVGLALVRAGDDRGWATVAEAARSKYRETRRTVCHALAGVRQAKSVEILIPLVGDRRPDPDFERLRGTGVRLEDHPVAPDAQAALRALTGQSLGEDPAKWAAWWKNEAKGQLPPVPSRPSESSDE